MVEGVVHLKMLVWHGDEKNSLQDSGLLFCNVDRTSGLLVKGLMLHIVAKGLYDRHPSVRFKTVHHNSTRQQAGSDYFRCYDSTNHEALAGEQSIRIAR